jgi:CRISPR/Cas system-associated exonuclease Cas4 (RecB family)
MLALCICSHHSGLIDCLGPNGGQTFNQRMNKPVEAAHLREATEALGSDGAARKQELSSAAVQEMRQRLHVDSYRGAVERKNALTAEGRIAHEKVADGGAESRHGVGAVFGLALRSFRLGLVGKADVVEISQAGGGGIRAFPVEHKQGRPKQKGCDRVQLCAQALCIAPRAGVWIETGARWTYI